MTAWPPPGWRPYRTSPFLTAASPPPAGGAEELLPVIRPPPSAPVPAFYSVQKPLFPCLFRGGSLPFVHPFEEHKI